jgi:hypothetical protein
METVLRKRREIVDALRDVTEKQRRAIDGLLADPQLGSVVEALQAEQQQLLVELRRIDDELVARLH